MEIDKEKFAAFLEDLQEFVKLSEKYREVHEGDDVQQKVAETIDFLVETGQLKAQDATKAKESLLYSKTAACDAVQTLAKRVKDIGDKLAPADLGTPVETQEKQAGMEKESDRKWNNFVKFAASN